jgi:hypothetical protein
MKVSKCVFMVLLMVSLCLVAWGDAETEEKSSATDVKKMPGYVHFPVKELLGDQGPKVEVMLEKPLLQILKAASSEQDPDFAELVDGISLIRVQVFEDLKDISEETPGKIDNLVTSLKEKQGWTPIVRVKEKGETVNILMKIAGSRVQGFSLVVQDGNELVFINIVGDLDSQKFGNKVGSLCAKFMSGNFDASQLEKLLSGKMGPKEPNLAITGYVKDAKTGKPIEGATVSDDQYGSEPYKSGKTDPEGKYSYKTWAEEHNIIAMAPGYKPQQKMLSSDLFQKDKDTVVNFELVRE